MHNLTAMYMIAKKRLFGLSKKAKKKKGTKNIKIISLQHQTYVQALLQHSSVSLTAVMSFISSQKLRPEQKYLYSLKFRKLIFFKELLVILLAT